MNYLVKGMESEQKMSILISFTNITSDRKVEALNLHFVKGMDISSAAAMADLPASNLSVLITRMNEVAEKCERYFEYKLLSK